MHQDRSGSRVVILLGAGASKEADLPLLEQLGDKVRHALSPSLGDLYEELLHAGLLPHEREWRTLEDVLTAADGLATSRLSFKNVDSRSASILAHEVRKRIWWILHRAPLEVLTYLNGLRCFISELGPLCIASLNNDLVMERWASRNKIQLSRGFRSDSTFDRAVFRDVRQGIDLLKLHGSVDWTFEPNLGLREIRGGPRETLKRFIAFRSPVPDIAVVFPSRLKVLQALPLRELMIEFDQRLKSADILIVVGCQLADPHIVEAITEGCRRNSHLKILIVDPDPLTPLMQLRGPLTRLERWDSIDLLPRPFGSALSERRLLDRVHSLKKGKNSFGWKLLTLLESFGRNEELYRKRLEAAIQAIEAGEVGQDELFDLRTLLDKFLPPLSVSGPASRLGRRIMGTLVPENTLGQSLKALKRCLRRVPNHPSPPHGHSLMTFGARVFYLHSSGISELQEEAGNLGYRDVGPSLKQPLGLGVSADHFVVSTLWLSSSGGLRRLETVDRRSERRTPRRIGRQGRSGWFEALRHLIDARAQGPASWKRALILAGYLSWSTAFDWVDAHTLVLVESRRVSLLRWPSLRVIATTGDRFLNLIDASVSSRYQRVYLAEAGAKGEGRLISVGLPLADRDSKTRSLLEFETLLSPVIDLGGLTSSPDGRHLVFSQRQPGLLMKVTLDENGSLVSPPSVLCEKLLVPRWLCWRRNHLFVATQLGIQRVQLEDGPIHRG